MKKLKKLISFQTGNKPEEVKLESHLINDLGADSLDVVELTMAIEEEYEIEIPDTSIDKWDNVQSIVTYLENEHKIKFVVE